MNDDVFLREVAAADIDVLLKWENDVENWEVSSTEKPFSREEIEFFVASKEHIFTHGQMRFMICLAKNNNPIGCIDFFEYNAETQKAGVGILIGEKLARNKGFASKALKLFVHLAEKKFNLITIFAEIDKSNYPSIRLFEKCKFNYIKNNIKNGKPIRYYELNLLHNA